MNTCKATVLMPVFNGAEYLPDAIKSILQQTFKDFEFIIIDDCSTDNSQAVIRTFNDSRIRLLVNDANIGIANSLNRGLDNACGEYVIRMDSDDFCSSDRLQKQIEFMDRNRNIAVSGCQIEYFGKVIAKEFLPIGPDFVRSFLLFDNPMAHPAVIIRKSVLDEHGLRYNPEFSRSEDYELWARVSEYADIDNIKSRLVRFRVHGNSVTAQHMETVNMQSAEIAGRFLRKFDIKIQPGDSVFHRRIGHGMPADSIDIINKASLWLTSLVEANERKRIYDVSAFNKAAGYIWFRLCRNSAGLGPDVYSSYKFAGLSSYFRPSFIDRLKFVASVLISQFRKK